MTRLLLLFASLGLALALAVLTSQTPRPRGLDAPATAFSAARAMTDIEQIARAPHPVGSQEHRRVRAYLTARMNQLGLSPEAQSGALTPASVRRLSRSGGDPAAAENQAVNLVGRLPGSDGTQPAVVLMAHYDTVVGSPGAADDSAGVAAILEAVRAIRARGPAERDLIVLFTDAEELGLDGARVFFDTHPWRDRIGAVVNLEARGGGGRAAMFETGRDNGAMIGLFAKAARRADGGPAATSLAAYMYERMPNGTDFTVARDKGIAGLNLAFLGRPGQYHAANSTPANLDQGSVQHIGSQALEAADALLRAPQPPGAEPSRVYGDILGLVLVSHSQAMGWGLLALVAGLGGFAAWRARRLAGLTVGQLGRGMLDGVWFVTSGFILLQAVRLLAGPSSSRAESAEVYYTLLRRLPWIEAGAVLGLLALALVLLVGRARIPAILLAAGVFLLTALILIVSGFSPIILGVGAVAAGLSFRPRGASQIWGGWLGLLALAFLLGCILQAVAPEAALLFVWPVLLGAVAAAIAAALGPDLLRPAGLLAPAAAVVLGGAWLAGVGHFVILGIGIDLPGALSMIGFLVLLFLRPLSPPAGASRAVLAGAAACLILACGLTLAGRFAEPEPAVAARTP